MYIYIYIHIHIQLEYATNKQAVYLVPFDVSTWVNVSWCLTNRHWFIYHVADALILCPLHIRSQQPHTQYVHL